MFIKGVVLNETKQEIEGKAGKVIVRNIKIRDMMKNGDEKHVFVKIYGENTIKTEVGKVVECEFYESVTTKIGKDNREHTYVNKIVV